MTVSEILDFATQSTGDISPEAKDFGRQAVRLKYKTLYDSHNWRESQRTIDGQLDPDLGGVYFLSVDAEEVISLSISYDGTSYTRLTYRERDWIERFGPRYTVPGALPWFYRAENLAWPILNPGKITFSTADPTTFPVFVAGQDPNGFFLGENFSVQGINNPGGTTGISYVQTENSYVKVLELSKGISTVPLQITDELGNAISMPPATTELMFSQIVLYPVPLFSVDQPLYVRTHCKLKADPLSTDMSVPRISHIWEALVCFTKSALYERMQQVQKSSQANQDGMAHIQAAVNVEKNQSEFRQQVVPIVYGQGLMVSDSINPFGSGWGDNF